MCRRVSWWTESLHIIQFLHFIGILPIFWSVPVVLTGPPLLNNSFRYYQSNLPICRCKDRTLEILRALREYEIYVIL